MGQGLFGRTTVMGEMGQLGLSTIGQTQALLHSTIQCIGGKPVGPEEPFTLTQANGDLNVPLTFAFVIGR